MTDSTIEQRQLAFWKFLVDTLTTEELMEAILISLGGKPYELKEVRNHTNTRDKP